MGAHISVYAAMVYSITFHVIFVKKIFGVISFFGNIYKQCGKSSAGNIFVYS